MFYFLVEYDFHDHDHVADKTGTGPLFFEYVRIRDFLLKKAAKEGRRLWWLFENTWYLDITTKRAMIKFVHYGLHF